jgi:hypothetical protein
MIVRSELEKLSVNYGTIDMGAVEIRSTITTEQLGQVKVALSKSGLEVMEDKKATLIEKIKNAATEIINDPDESTGSIFPASLSKKFKHTYTFILIAFFRRLRAFL